MDIVQREGEKLARLLFPEETKGVPWAKLVALISGEADLMGLKKSISDPSIFDLTYPLIAMWLRKLSEDLRPSKHLEVSYPAKYNNISTINQLWYESVNI